MKVFVSCRLEDLEVAELVVERFGRHDVDCHLDVFAPEPDETGEKLADHVRAGLSTCTDLVAVVTETTRSSWWVPWQMGIPTEKDYPLASFAARGCEIPAYLARWPHLARLEDIDTYVELSRQVRRRVDRERVRKTDAELREAFVKTFPRELRAALETRGA